MRRHPHWFAIALLLLVFGFDLAVWGGAARLPEVGPLLLRSAQHEAPLVRFYMLLGQPLDAAVPPLDGFGQRYAERALGEGFARIRSEPQVAMDLIFSNTWNSQHALVKTLFWAVPVLLVISLLLWLKRPKKVHLLQRRR